MAEAPSGGPVVYIDRSDIQAGRWDELKDGISELVAFVDRHQPQMAAYGFYLDEHTNEMTVVAVHPDSTSLERHIEVGGPEFKKLGHLLQLREIEIFGPLSERAVELVRQKAAALGRARAVTLHEQFAGFDRVNTPRHEQPTRVQAPPLHKRSADDVAQRTRARPATDSASIWS